MNNRCREAQRTEGDKEERDWAKIFAVIFGVSGFSILVVYLSVAYYPSWEHWPGWLVAIRGNEDNGQIGDFVGGVAGSLWAFAGVLLFWSALVLQRREFKLQRETLDTQLDVFKSQSKTMEKNNRELEIQNRNAELARIFDLFRYSVDELRERVSSLGIGGGLGVERANGVDAINAFCREESFSQSVEDFVRGSEFKLYHSFLIYTIILFEKEVRDSNPSSEIGHGQLFASNFDTYSTEEFLEAYLRYGRGGSETNQEIRRLDIDRLDIQTTVRALAAYRRLKTLGVE